MSVLRRSWRRSPDGWPEGELVVVVLGWWVRLYLGRSFWPRPLVERWAASGHRGVVVRTSSGMPGRTGIPVLGAQVRRG